MNFSEEGTSPRLLSYLRIAFILTTLIIAGMFMSCSIPEWYYEEQLIAHQYHLELRYQYEDCDFCQYWRTQNFY